MTQRAARDFEESLARIDMDAKDRPAWIQKAMRGAITRQLADLQSELAGYDALRAGHVRVLERVTLPTAPGRSPVHWPTPASSHPDWHRAGTVMIIPQTGVSASELRFAIRPHYALLR